MLRSVSAPAVRVALRQQSSSVPAKAYFRGASLLTPFGQFVRLVSTLNPAHHRNMSSYRELSLEQLYNRLTTADAKQLANVTPDAPIRLPAADASLEQFKAAHQNLLDEEAVPLNKFESALQASLPERFQNVLRFDLTPAQIKELTAEVIRTQQRVLDSVAALKEGWTWDNTLGAMEAVDGLTEAFGTMIDFPGHVSADKAVRDASSDASKELQQFGIASQMRSDVYQSVLAFSETAEANALEGERARLLKNTLRDYRRNGLHLAPEVRDKVKEIKQRMSALCVDFHKNVGEEDTQFEFTREELEGLPEDKLESLPKTADGSKFVVSLKYPDYFPVMDFCKVASTRFTMAKANSSRCLEANTPILEEIIRLRHEKAQLLGYGCHADFVLDVRMAKTRETVEKFLSQMVERVQPTSEKEMAYLLQLKEAECKATGAEFDGKIHAHEFRYFLKQAEQKMYDFDSNVVKPYFPLDVVLRGVFEIYQRVLGLRFEEVENPHVWHESVRLFNVYNAELTPEEAKELPEELRFDAPGLVGQFYVDLFPRPGKYSHAACFGLVPGHGFGTPGHQHPVAAMVANFPSPSGDKPSLLCHSDVVTLVHEFGHVVHQILTETQLSSFAGTRVETDFVECPSQICENWAWEPEALEKLSGHFERPQEKLPEEYLRKMLAAKNANIGLFTKRQLSFGLYDMHIHSRAEVDTAAAWAQIQLATLGIEAIPGTNFAASFGHLTGGYDSGYYGYMYSEVFSADMFRSGFKAPGKSVLDSAVGRRYRRAVLARGGTRDGGDMLRDFLGRDPSLDAWMASKGLVADDAAVAAAEQ